MNEPGTSPQAIEIDIEDEESESESNNDAPLNKVTSKVWSQFGKVVDGKLVYGICNLCPKTRGTKRSFNGGSTSGFWKHLKKEYVRVNEQYYPRSSSQSLLNLKASGVAIRGAILQNSVS